ncbi:hypothetical protein [uncultured Gammaproteobacteria bacterium]|nr:hypothetical protein [uncultured Gammaproteobacteria bacterium]
MKTQLKVVALSVLVATSTYAQENKDMYFGLGMAQSKSNGSEYIDDGGGNTTLVDFQYKKKNWKALIGMRLDSNWSIEGQYTDFSTDELTANGVETGIDMSGKSLGVAGLYHFNPQGDYSPFVKLGWHYWDLDVTSPVGSDSGDGNHAFYGIGIDGKINETIKYRVEFERMSLDDGDNMNNIGVGLLFGF